MKSILVPFGGVDHFLVYLNEDTGDRESEKPWLGNVDIKKGEFLIYKEALFLDQGIHIKGFLNPEDPGAQLNIEFVENSWNKFSILLLTTGLSIGGVGTWLDGLGIYSWIGTIISLLSPFTLLIGNYVLKADFNRYLVKYERHVYLQLKDAHYRHNRWGKKS